MPAQPHTAETKLEIDRGAHTIRMARVFYAPRAAIFAAWTQPEQVTCWWEPAGEPLTTCEIDLRPGGAFRFVSKGRPDMPFSGVYSEIASPDRLIFEAMGATGRVVLRDVAGETHMVVEIQCRSAEHLDQFLEMGVHTGTSQTLDNLVAYARGRSIAIDEPA